MALDAGKTWYAASVATAIPYSTVKKHARALGCSPPRVDRLTEIPHGDPPALSLGWSPPCRNATPRVAHSYVTSSVPRPQSDCGSGSPPAPPGRAPLVNRSASSRITDPMLEGPTALTTANSARRSCPVTLIQQIVRLQFGI
jgi:hypothetical protein